MNLDSRIKKTTIVSAIFLVLSLTASVQAVGAVTSSGSSASAHAMKINLIRTSVLDPNAIPSTSGQPASASNDVPTQPEIAANDIPGKVTPLTDSGQGTSTTGQGSLNTPQVQGLDVSGNAEGTKTVKGLNAYDLWSTHLHFNVEPPDQMLCASQTFVMEGVNDNVRVYTASLKPASTVQTIEAFFGLPIPAALFALSDPKCTYDSGHWFVTVTVPFQIPSFVLLAVSATNSPLGAWNIYAIDTTNDGTDGTPANPGCPCIGDQPLLAANGNAVFISTNEFGAGFNGANMYIADEAALAAGAASVNLELFTLGLSLSTPDGPCYAGGVNTGICWYTVQPATSPGGRSGNDQGGNNRDDNGQGSGVEYALSALQFGDPPYTLIDNRIAEWAFTNTQSISSNSPNVGVQVTVIGTESYENPITFAAQKAGPTPRGDLCKFGNPATRPCADGIAHIIPSLPLPGPIQPNDDRMNQVVFADGLLWGGLNSAMQVSSGEDGPSSIHNGIAYFVVQPSWHHGVLQGHIHNQGYVAASGADLLFPSIGVTNDGQGVLVFTLTGHNFYPSAAYVTINEHGTGEEVIIAAMGQSPSDGFTEFQFFGTGAFRPRWGDYSAAFTFGGKVFFATEYIQSPSCSDSAFAIDPSCGGTRGRSANWGTSISVLSP